MKSRLIIVLVAVSGVWCLTMPGRRVAVCPVDGGEGSEGASAGVQPAELRAAGAGPAKLREAKGKGARADRRRQLPGNVLELLFNSINACRSC